MYGIANTQFDCAWVGNYLLEIGDKLAITQENDEVIEVFLISDTITFAGTLDEVSSWEFADEQTETYADPITIGERLNQTYARVNNMEKNIMLYVSDVVEEVVNDLVPPKIDEMTDALYEDVADIKVSQATIASKVSQLELTTDNINQRVEKTEKTVTTLEGTVESNKQEAIDESKDYTDTQLETVITTVTQIDSKVAELDITTEAIEQKVSTTEQKIVNIESSVDDAVTTVETMKTEVGAMKVTSDTVLATVSSVERKVTEVEGKLEDADDVTNARIDSLARDVSLKLDKKGVEIAVESVLTEGVDKVVTASKKYTFDDQGLNVSSSDSEFSTMVTENGMTISKQNNEVLTVNNQGVQAADLHARTFLIIGENSRLEDRGRRTACFWIGPAGG
jgi:phage shock protein A